LAKEYPLKVRKIGKMGENRLVAYFDNLHKRIMQSKDEQVRAERELELAEKIVGAWNGLAKAIVRSGHWAPIDVMNNEVMPRVGIQPTFEGEDITWTSWNQLCRDFKNRKRELPAQDILEGKVLVDWMVFYLSDPKNQVSRAQMNELIASFGEMCADLSVSMELAAVMFYPFAAVVSDRLKTLYGVAGAASEKSKKEEFGAGLDQELESTNYNGVKKYWKKWGLEITSIGEYLKKNNRAPGSY
jgi:hypothetical protein